MDDHKAILERIINDPRYRANLDWGIARSGHPEGTVRNHIDSLERHLESIRHRITDTDYWKLKILIHVHDTFKAEAKVGAPITDHASHASLARAFLEQYCHDPDLSAMVRYHDEPFALWRQFEAKGTYSADRLNQLVTAIKDWDLFLTFVILDGGTPGKSREPLKWFLTEIQRRLPTRISVDDIW